MSGDPELEFVDFTRICKIRRSASHELSTQILLIKSRMSIKKLSLVLIASAVSLCFQIDEGRSQNILKRMRDRMGQGREDNRLVDRFKQRLDEAKKSAESTAKDIEKRLRGNAKNERGEPTLADPRNQGNQNQPNKTFGARPNINSNRSVLNNGRSSESQRSSGSQLRGADLQQRGSRVVIGAIDPQSAAAKSGLKRGDIILKLAELEVKSLKDINEVMGVMRPSDRVMLIVGRDNAKEEILLEAADESASNEQGGFAPGPLSSGPLDSGPIGSGARTNDENAVDQNDGYSNSIRSVLNRVRQASSTGAGGEGQIELRQEVRRLQTIVEKQNQMILDLQQQLNNMRSRSNNQQNDRNNPQLLGPRRGGN